MKNKRVLFHDKGVSLSIQKDGFDELLVFTSSNGIGFTGDTMLDLIEKMNGAKIALREFDVLKEEFKDIVNDKAPAILGMDSYVSQKKLEEEEIEKKRDKLLKQMSIGFDDAI